MYSNYINNTIRIIIFVIVRLMTPLYIVISSIILLVILLYLTYIFIEKKNPKEGWFYNNETHTLSIVLLPLFLIFLIMILYIFIEVSYIR